MFQLFLSALIFFGLFISEATAAVEEPSQGTVIALDKPVHFIAPNGDDVVVPPGVYTIEVTEEWLRLSPGKARDALLLQAQESRHEERVEEPVALSIPSDQDRHYLVVLLPGGETFAASGTYTGVRSRAALSPSFNRTTLNKALVIKQQTLIGSKPSSQTSTGPSAGAKAQEIGAPPPPVLLTPAAGQTFPEPTGITFSWRPGVLVPPNGSVYEVLAWKQGTTQAEERANRQQAVQLAKGFPLITLKNKDLPDEFLGKNVRWIVKACAPKSNPSGLSLSGNSSLACSESTHRDFSIQFPTPRLQTPAGGKVNARLHTKENSGLLKAEGYSRRTQNLLFCVAKPGHTCGTTPTGFNNPNTFVLPIRPPQFPTTTFSSQHSLPQFIGQTVNWSAAACHPAVGCVWAPPQPLTIFPDPPSPTLLGAQHFAWFESPIHTFGWSIPEAKAREVKTYKFCLWYQQHPHEPPNQCVLTRQTSRTFLRIDAKDIRNQIPRAWGREHLAWSVEACNEGACSSPPLEGIKYVVIRGVPEQVTLQDPPRWIQETETQMHLSWNNTKDADTTFFVPCLRDGNKTCENGNEIFDARFQKSQTSSTNYSCDVQGSYPKGETLVKFWQVGACNEVWGCVWSTPSHVTFAIPERRNQPSLPPQRLTCPRIPN